MTRHILLGAAAVLAASCYAPPARSSAVPDPPVGAEAGSTQTTNATPLPRPGLEIRLAPEPDVAASPTPDIAQSFVVTNTGATDLILHPEKLRQRGRVLDTTWTGADHHLIGPEGETVPARGRAVLTLNATALEPGRYTATIRAQSGGETRAVYEFAIDRRGKLPGAGVLATEGGAKNLTLNALGDGKADLTFIVQNPSSTPLRFNEPFVSVAAKASGRLSGQETLSSSDPRIDCGQKDPSQARTFPVTVAPGARCKGLLSVQVPAAGAYTIKATANGAEGGEASVDLVLNARAPLLWAAGLTLAGTMAGSAIARWRTKGRIKTTARLAVARERERLAGLSVMARNLRRDLPADEIDDALTEIGLAVDDDRKTDPEPDLAPLRTRLHRLEDWLEIAEDLGELRAPQADLLAAWAALGQPLSDLTTPEEQLGAALSELRGRVAAAQAADDANLAAMDGVDVRRAGVREAARRTTRRVARDIGKSSRYIEGLLRTNDRLADLVLGAVVCATAISTTWLADAAWGGSGDLLGLVLATFTAQAGAVTLATPGATPR